MLGIIGGMGPMASSLFYNVLIEKTPAESDQDHMDLIMISHASMPDRTKAILSGDEKRINEIKDLLEKDIRSLIDAGCEHIAVTCNTAHYFIDLLGPEKKAVLHMIDETAGEAGRRSVSGRAALLATDGTVRTGIYQDSMKKHGIHVLTPSGECQKNIMSVIYDHVKSGRPVPARLWQSIHDEISAMDCDCAVLGCTELSVAARDLSLDISDRGFYIDPLDILAKRCVEIYKEKTR